MSERARGSAPRCPFCGADLARPGDFRVSSFETAQGGRCACGAVYLMDPTGKNVGQIMMQALGIAADQLGKGVGDLATGEDYEDAVLSYDWRTHRSSGPVTGYRDGYGRLYVIRVARKG